MVEQVPEEQEQLSQPACFEAEVPDATLVLLIRRSRLLAQPPQFELLFMGFGRVLRVGST